MKGEGAGTPESDRVDGARHPRETMAFVGHAAAERAFLEAYRAGRMPHAWIIGGAEGIGKATLAWRVARFLLANPDPHARERPARTHARCRPDEPRGEAACRPVVLRRGASAPRMEREGQKALHRNPGRRGACRNAHLPACGRGSGWRIAIIDSADDLNRNAANALLKLIEEPPGRSLFLLIAHRPGRILPTIRSRCRLLMLEPLSDDEVARALEISGMAPFRRGEIEAVATRAGGSMKQALRLLQGELEQIRRQSSTCARRVFRRWIGAKYMRSATRCMAGKTRRLMKA